MKRITFTILFALLLSTVAFAQDFKKSTASAKTAYQAKNLEETHFALQQMIQDLDILIGQEVLKLFPANLDSLKSLAQEDHIGGNVSFVGATIHRTYNSVSGAKKADLEVINNSPLLATLNAYLSSPYLSAMGGDGKTKVIKVQGYKARLTKEESYNNQQGYSLEIPLTNAMVSLKLNNTTEQEILALFNLVPLAKIADLIQ